MSLENHVGRTFINMVFFKILVPTNLTIAPLEHFSHADPFR